MTDWLTDWLNDWMNDPRRRKTLLLFWMIKMRSVGCRLDFLPPFFWMYDFHLDREISNGRADFTIWVVLFYSIGGFQLRRNIRFQLLRRRFIQWQSLYGGLWSGIIAILYRHELWWIGSGPVCTANTNSHRVVVQYNSNTVLRSGSTPYCHARRVRAPFLQRKTYGPFFILQ